MKHTKRLSRSVVGMCLLVAVAVSGVGDAGGAGITTHRWMAEEAIDRVDIPALRVILGENLAMLQTGVGFPDIGYFGGNTYGETAHWQRYVDNLVDAIADRDDCGDLTDPAGPCAELIAFTFGIAAHGMGDEVFDWLFEPNGPDRDEYFTGVVLASETGAESQMDVVAIGRYGVPRPLEASVPDEAMVLAAFDASGQSGIDPAEFDLVPLLPGLWDVEKGQADGKLAAVEAAMPWMSANLVTAPGGVDFAATAIAGYWTSLWGRLNGDQPPTRVSITYPAPGQVDVPATGWERDRFLPGSARDRGGARNRITAALTSARPYVDASGGLPVSDEFDAAAMTITDVATGEVLPVKEGFPRSVPYGSDGGEHLIDVQPAADLDACTWYRVDVSVDAPLLDARGEPVTPYSWEFRTACAQDAGPDEAPVTSVSEGDHVTVTPQATGAAPPASTLRARPDYTG